MTYDYMTFFVTVKNMINMIIFKERIVQFLGKRVNTKHA